jgi:hypothetical protein
MTTFGAANAELPVMVKHESATKSAQRNMDRTEAP